MSTLAALLLLATATSLGVGCGAPTAPINPSSPMHSSMPNNAPPLQQPPVPTTSCGSVPVSGVCVNQAGHQLVRSCDPSSNSLRPDVDCTVQGKACGYDSTGTLTCQALGGSKSSGQGNSTGSVGTACGTLTYGGTCNGNTIHYCFQGQVVDQPCASGFNCVTDGRCGGVGAQCCSGSSTRPYTGGTGSGLTCNGVSALGACPNPTTLEFCDITNQLATIPCRPGDVCGWDVTQGLYNCLPGTGITAIDNGIGAFCSVGGAAGTCMASANCLGLWTPGYCPGGTIGVGCCTPFGSIPTGGTPCTVSGIPGSCMDVGACAGTATPGHCPGPANIQCCT
jgi:hypothetical protein